MSREELDRKLDEWLDRAADEYGRTEIRPGFEARIIASVNSSSEKRTWHFHWAPIAAAIAAALFLGAYLMHAQFQSRGKMQIASKENRKLNSNPKPGLRQAPQENAAVREKNAIPKGIQTNRARSRAKAVEIQGGRFLSSGLSDQERYLIAFARLASENDIIGLSENAKFALPSFEISPFKIE